jgi:hypothetical protein
MRAEWAVSAGFAARALREGERGKDDRGFGEMIELSGRILKYTRDLVGDLLGLKMRAIQTYPT